MRINWLKCLFLSVFLTAFWVFAPFLAADCHCASSGDALILTDVHFDPFYDSSLFQDLLHTESGGWADVFMSSSITDMPGYGSETNYPLLDAVLDSALLQVPDPAFVVFTGDILRHGFSETFFAAYGSEDQSALERFILKTVTFFAGQIQEHFPEAPVFFTPGNNDAYVGNYALAPGGAYLDQTAQPLYEAFLQNRATCADYDNTYKAGGYFRADVSNMVVLSLNSVLFSHRRPAPLAGNAAWAQLDWFAAQLADARAKGLAVAVVTHIPPGVDIFATSRAYLDDDGRLSDAQLMWHREYNDRFLSIVDEYVDTISMIYAGHTHMDEFRFMDGAGGGKVPVEVTPSISPLFGNNPGYRVIETSADGAELTDYQAFTMSLQETPQAFAAAYDFQQEYAVSAPDGTGLPQLHTLIHQSASSKDFYIAKYYGGSSGSSAITDTNWPVYYCGIANMRRDSMVACVNEYVPWVPNPPLWLLLGMQ